MTMIKCERCGRVYQDDDSRAPLPWVPDECDYCLMDGHIDELMRSIVKHRADIKNMIRDGEPIPGVINARKRDIEDKTRQIEKLNNDKLALDAGKGLK